MSHDRRPQGPDLVRRHAFIVEPGGMGLATAVIVAPLFDETPRGDERGSSSRRTIYGTGASASCIWGARPGLGSAIRPYRAQSGPPVERKGG
jgi:hypothetical protein